MPTSAALLRPVFLLVASALLSALCETRPLMGEVPSANGQRVQNPPRSFGLEPAATAAPAPPQSEAVGDQASEEGETPARDQAATHRQTAIIRPATESQSALKAFIVAPDGRIIALVQLSAPPDEDEVEEALEAAAGEASGQASQPKKLAKPACEVRIFSPDGDHKRLAAWHVSFLGQTLALGPDNLLYIAGSGRAGRYSLEGKEQLVTDSPQTILIGKDETALREAAEAEIEATKESYKQIVEMLGQQRDALAARLEKASAQQAKLIELQLKQFDAQIKQRSGQNRSVEQVMVAITERLKRVNAIAVGDKEVFITCPQAKGYGYAVWRTNLDFAEPECIVTGLSGCCGQMDVACGDGDLWVAENSRHRVVRYNREGKRLSAFGKRDRDGVGGYFGGCCNPMNLCFDPAGDVLVSESNGQVKHFSAKGKFVELCGIADVKPGCKNSAIRISPDGEQIYYIDVQKSQILVLTRDPKNEDDTKKGS